VRILADENVPMVIVEALRSRGHDVSWAVTDAPASSDETLLARASADQRLLVTLDKDFGELAFRTRQAAANGIVLIRARAPSPAELTRIAVAALESRDDWSGHFAVVEDDRIRMTRLP
jgi:predicted nuclease of predicted toxin-antitoxin system